MSWYTRDYVSRDVEMGGRTIFVHIDDRSVAACLAPTEVGKWCFRYYRPWRSPAKAYQQVIQAAFNKGLAYEAKEKRKQAKAERKLKVAKERAAEIDAKDVPR